MRGMAPCQETVPVAGGPSVPAWSHKKQEMVKMYSHRLENLVPGVSYEFQVYWLPPLMSCNAATYRVLLITDYLVGML